MGIKFANDRQAKIVGITLLILIALAILGFLFVSHNDFDDFRELKEKLVEYGQAASGREIYFFWNKNESRLGQTEEKNDGSLNVKNEMKAKADDLDNDGRAEELVLAKGYLAVKRGGKLIWRTPKDWWVDDFFLADSNGDGKKEINLSVWKAGDFGASKPFWIKQNNLSVKNHFFVMSLAEDKVQPLWQSSNLEKPNCEFLFSDIDGNDKQELIVIEGEYNDKYVCQGKYLALWRWNGWGFVNEWRSLSGQFAGLQLSEDGRDISVLIE